MSSGRIADLVIAGVPKAATGSLFAYLAQHPDICGSDIKELGYFNHYNPARTQHIGPPPPLEEYASHWAHWSGERYALEATPTYSYGGRPVIDAMRKVLGSPKVILILRDPAERLWSAYTFQHSVGNNAQIGTFEEYVGVLEQRRRDGVPLVPNDGMHGLHIGFYADYVGEWLDEFGDDMRIVFLDDLRRDPCSVVERLCGWLEIDTEVARSLDYQSRNVTRHPRSKRLARTARLLKRRTERLNLLPRSAQQRLRPLYSRLNAGELTEQFDPAVRRHVEEVYRESNRTTAGILAAHGYRDLPAWLQTGSTV
jgi:Sulfotransferase domain